MSNRRENTRRALEAEGATPQEVDEAIADIEAEEDDRDPNARARRAGVPRRYLGVTFEDLDLDEAARNAAIATARGWAAEVIKPGGDRRGLYLWSTGGQDEDVSGFGTGKTRIAAAVAQHALQDGALRVRWLDIVRAMTDLNLPFGHPTYARAATRLSKPGPDELVVLDDIDKQPPTDRNVQPIFALVNDCVNDEVPLLITANRDVDDLLTDWGERFGVAVASRIAGHCVAAEVRGRDRRLDPA